MFIQRDWAAKCYVLCEEYSLHKIRPRHVYDRKPVLQSCTEYEGGETIAFASGIIMRSNKSEKV